MAIGGRSLYNIYFNGRKRKLDRAVPELLSRIWAYHRRTQHVETGVESGR